MTDLMQDDFAVLETFVATCWPIDHDEVTAAFGGITEKAARGLIQEQKDLGRLIEVEEPMMLRSARLALALEQVVREGGFDAVAEFDQVWLPDEKIGIIPFFGTSRMLEHHVPFTCEADVLRALSMLVLEELAGHSTFLEHYILDYRRNLMFNSHDGHGNPSLADPRQPVRIVPTIYNGRARLRGLVQLRLPARGGDPGLHRLPGRRQVPAHLGGGHVEMSATLPLPRPSSSGTAAGSCPSLSPGCSPPLPTTTPPPMADSIGASP
jgi:hypothetical protein